MTIYVNDLGTVKLANEIYVNDLGTRKPVKEGWVNDEGVIKNFFEVTASHIVTQGILGGFIGYADSQIGLNGFGSIAPLTYNGIIVLASYYSPVASLHTFNFFLQGNRVGAAFTSLEPEDQGVLLRTAGFFPDGLYNSGTDSTQWLWTDQTKPAVWDGTGAVDLEII